MSRIGKKPVNIPGKVKVGVSEGRVTVEGPKGTLSRQIADKVQVAVEGGKVVVTRTGDDRQSRSMHGLMRALIQNMVTGVSDGFEKKLEIVGIGYKAELAGPNLTLSLGYSHPVVYGVPKGISIEVEKGTRLVVRGADRQVVGEAAAKIRGFRPPDAYKGKGIRYVNEVVKLKAGKAAGK
ncbi:50S ribosomal protein L6 [Myxococcota bacterium]|nr:50S ribosomal protein L6 [Myxococcota bacterium]